MLLMILLAYEIGLAQMQFDWARNFPEIEHSIEDVIDMVLDPNGAILVTGSSITFDSSGADIVTIKYGHVADQLWAYRYDSEGGFDDVPSAIASDKFGNVSVTYMSPGTVFFLMALRIW